MGCLNDAELDQNELILARNERFLCLHLHPAEDVDLTLRKYGSTEWMNDTQFEYFMKALGLPRTAQPGNMRIGEFYLQYHTEIGYNRNCLLVMCLMTSSGSLSTKAELLFDVMDKDISEVINREAVSWLFNEMISVAVTRMAVLITEPQKRESKTMMEYIQKLETRSAAAVDDLVSVVLKDEDTVKKSKFLARLERADLFTIGTCSGMREFVLTKNTSLANQEPTESSPNQRVSSKSKQRNRLKTVHESKEISPDDSQS